MLAAKIAELDLLAIRIAQGEIWCGLNEFELRPPTSDPSAPG